MLMMMMIKVDSDRRFPFIPTQSRSMPTSGPSQFIIHYHYDDYDDQDDDNDNNDDNDNDNDHEYIMLNMAHLCVTLMTGDLTYIVQMCFCVLKKIFFISY